MDDDSVLCSGARCSSPTSGFPYRHMGHLRRVLSLPCVWHSFAFSLICVYSFVMFCILSCSVVTFSSSLKLHPRLHSASRVYKHRRVCLEIKHEIVQNILVCWRIKSSFSWKWEAEPNSLRKQPDTITPLHQTYTLHSQTSSPGNQQTQTRPSAWQTLKRDLSLQRSCTVQLYITASSVMHFT